MPIQYTKRRLRKVFRNGRNWMQVIGLTLKGNQIEKRSNLAGSNHPVLLIQGFGSTRRTFSIMERRLHREGFQVFSVHLGGIFNTFNSKRIEELAEFIHSKIDSLYKKYQFTGKMSIIAHSKGGLIGRYYIQCLGGKERVRHLITLATPHNGNLWALIGVFTPIGWFMDSVRQMTPFSPLIKKLQKLPFPSHVRLTSIYSQADKITLYPGALLDAAEYCPNISNICVEGIGHSEFLIKKSVYSHIKHSLRLPLLGEQRSRVPNLKLVESN